MKSTVLPAAQKGQYPVLKIAKNGQIILFTSPDTGTCVCLGSCESGRLGEFYKGWAEVYFDIFTGSVVLEN